MSEETRKVLEMLTEGKINAADAERLLNKLSDAGAGSAAGAGTAAPKEPPTGAKFLRVLVDTGEGHDVNVRIPLAFVRSGVRLLGMLPPKVAETLNHKGVNFEFLSSLRGKELEETLNAMHVDINTDEGQHVRVFCE
jgi:hypothetical protein